MIVAIHQPNFFPWLGYFNKIARSRKFILLDMAQFPKTGGSWVNRVKMLLGGQEQWLTVPIKRPSGSQAIGEVVIQDFARWADKTKKTIVQNYRKHPCFEQGYALVEPLLGFETESLSAFNIHAIRSLSAALSLDDGDKFALESEMGVDSTGTRRLVELCKRAGATAYLSGDGSSGYLEEDAFREAGLGLLYQGFKPAPYPQKSGPGFIAGLSILDALFNIGVEETAKLVQSS